MEIRSLSIKELKVYISSDAFNLLEVAPITPERVISQAENPHSAPDDPALWIAESDDGRVIGFAGSLPSGEVHNNRRMGWNSCWWVDPDRGREFALPLLYKFLSYWDQHVAFADMTLHTYSIINQLGFCYTREELLIQDYVRLSGKRILQKTGILGRVAYPAIKVVVLLVNSIQYLRMSFAVKLDEQLKMEIREHIDDEIYTFIRKHQGADFLQRSMDDYRWIEGNPWLVKHSEDTRELNGKYPFSYQVSEFKWEWLISWRDGSITSVMLTSMRDGDLKVLYYFGDQPEDAMKVLKNLIYKDSGIRSVLFAHPKMLVHNSAMRAVWLHSRSRTRYVGVSKEILKSFPEDMIIQLGDGDSVFT